MALTINAAENNFMKVKGKYIETKIVAVFRKY